MLASFMLTRLSHVLEGASGAVASFNVLSLDMARALIDAAEFCHRPVIIGIAVRHWEAIQAPLIIPSTLSLLKQASVPTALHLDPAKPHTRAVVDQAIGLGFTSIMYGGSGLPYDENTEQTAAVVSQCHEREICVEGELGAIAGEEGVADQSEESGVDLRAQPSDVTGAGGRKLQSNLSTYTAPEKAERFVRETGVDALAIAVGTSHGISVEQPHINVSTIQDAHTRCPNTHLVLHGATGVSAESIGEAVVAGVRKINYFSGLLRDGMTEVRASGDRADNDYLGFMQRLSERWRQDAVAQIRLYAEE